MGCYPLFVCGNWAELHLDLEAVAAADLVSVALVTDPFGDYDEAYLRECFPDLVRPFKDHFVTDLRRPVRQIVSKHHRYYARRALKQVVVTRCPEPMQFLDEWVALYATLIERHQFRGIKAFSRAAFSSQLSLPGLVLFQATFQGSTVGAHLWYVQGEVAYSHLAAFSPLGYELMVSYGLYWSALSYFVDRVRWLQLGAGAGISRRGTDGLRQFKQGWATGTRIAYLCGRIFDHESYEEIVRARGVGATEYFPAYRKGEFG
jgi:hypothetical protein